MLTIPSNPAEGPAVNFALAMEADEAISRVFGSSEHDQAVAALEEVQRVKQSGADSLQVLETLAATSAIAKWEALYAKLTDTAEMVSQGLPEDSRGDGTTYSGHVTVDSFSLSSDGMVSKFRRAEAQTLDTESPYPGNVAVNLRACAQRVLSWLKEEQRRCGQEAPLAKHDRFVRLCHEVLSGEGPPDHLLALDLQQGEM
ncbi:MAG: hypothetical protein F4Z00_12410 [Acidimicrobiaceae bacterium]|nr:hypothetical protein [Acidimicrobiaceae bacterium]MXZ66330.1 hypothetical protein [Acidimicrobiaceae bacterium]MYF32312.1 hypothetical protein [Acidimicrobiaceae bacterium]MYG77528.1 hypothetical protein [Acidimicrobiaceae bacterium]